MPSSPLRRNIAVLRHDERRHLWKHFVEGMNRDFEMLDSRLRNKEMSAEEYMMSLRVHYMYFQGLSERYKGMISKEWSELESKAGVEYVDETEC